MRERRRRSIGQNIAVRQVAVDGDFLAGIGRTLGSVGGARGTGQQDHKIFPTHSRPSRNLGQLLHGLRFHGRALIAGFGLEQGHIRRDGHHLRRCAYLQFGIDGGETDLHRDGATDQLLKAIFEKCHRVGARYDRIRVIQARVVGGVLLRYAGIDIHHRDRHSRNQGPRTVSHGAADVARVCALRKASPACKSQKEW